MNLFPFQKSLHYFFNTFIVFKSELGFTFGNTKEFNPVQTTGANLGTAVTEDSNNFAETVKALTISNQVEGEMFDEKYATLPVKKKVETQVPD